MKKLSLIGLVLMSCQMQANQTAQKSETQSSVLTEKINKAVYGVLSGDDFKEIDGTKFYGAGANEAGSRSYVSKLPREEVMSLLSAAIDPYVESQPWGDDYGQYHGTFKVKGTENMQFGLGVSVLKPKKETFKDAPEILENYDSDIVYTPPYEWTNP